MEFSRIEANILAQGFQKNYKRRRSSITNVVNDTAVVPLAPGGNSILVFCFAENTFKLAVKLPVLHSNLIAQIAVWKLHF